MDKLVSRIPPPPRVPKVDGATPIAQPALDDGARDDAAGGRVSLPRWRARQIARSREVMHASGAVIAALLLAALIAWASTR